MSSLLTFESNLCCFHVGWWGFSCAIQLELLLLTLHECHPKWRAFWAHWIQWRSHLNSNTVFHTHGSCCSSHTGCPDHYRLASLHRHLICVNWMSLWVWTIYFWVGEKEGSFSSTLWHALPLWKARGVSSEQQAVTVILLQPVVPGTVETLPLWALSGLSLNGFLLHHCLFTLGSSLCW